VQSLGYQPGKHEWMDTVVESVNFSFILEGRGSLHCNDQVFPVEAPCVMLQSPGARLKYGPEPSGASWDELFIMYSRELMATLSAWGIRLPEQPVWPIKSSRTVRALVDELLICSQDRETEGAADRVDRICERLLLESRVRRLPEPTGPYDIALNEIRSHLANTLNEQPDFMKLALEHGMSPTNFRRHWARRFGVPPGQYLIDLRLQQASRLLTETNAPVKEIAHAVGFKDPLYFSRCFSKAFASSPTAYRQQFSVARAT